MADVVLSDGQFDLDGFVFGDGTAVVADLDVGERSLEVQDRRLMRRGGVRFGRDMEVAPEWTFSLGVNDAPGLPARAALSALRAAWAGPIDRPGEASVLRYNLNGVTRRVFGRPRRFQDVDVKGVVNNGVGLLLASFQLADVSSYSDERRVVSLSTVPESTGGLIAPLSAPLSTRISGGMRAGLVDVGGDSSTPLRVRFIGPITNPWLAGPGWRVELRASIPYDRSVTLDAGSMTVLWENGASAAGALTRQSRLDLMRFEPGLHEVTFGGADLTGLSRAEVSWFDAWHGF